MATTIQKQIINNPVEGVWLSVVEHLEQISSLFWFLLCLSLFVILGPFAAPVAVVALFKLGLDENDLEEPESIA